MVKKTIKLSKSFPIFLIFLFLIPLCFSASPGQILAETQIRSPSVAANIGANNTFPGVDQQLFANSGYNFTTGVRDDAAFNRVYDSANLVIQQSDQVAYRNTSLTPLGTYNATYSFENDRSGGLAVGFSPAGSGLCQVLDSYVGHQKVLYMARSAGTYDVIQTFTAGAQTTGTISFWYCASVVGGNAFLLQDVADANGINLYSNVATFYFYGAGPGSITMAPFVANRWYYFTITFDTATDKCTIWQDGVKYVDNLAMTAMGAATHWHSQTTTTIPQYYDAVDYSWTPGYDASKSRNAIDLGQLGVYNATHSFEDDVPFALPAAAYGSSIAATGRIYVRPSMNNGHRNTLKLTESAAGLSYAFLDFTDQAGVFAAEAWMRLTSIGAGAGEGWRIYDSAAASVLTIQFDQATAKLQCYSGGAAGTALLSYVAGTWYHVRAVVDIPTNKYSIWVNGMLLASSVTLAAAYANVANCRVHQYLTGEWDCDALDFSTDPQYYPERSAYLRLNSTQSFSVPGSYSYRYQIWSAGTCFDQYPVPFQVVASVQNPAIILARSPGQDASIYGTNPYTFAETVVDATGTTQFDTGTVIVQYSDGSTREYAGSVTNASGVVSISASVTLNITGQYSYYVVAASGGYSIRSPSSQFTVIPNVDLISTSSDATAWQIFTSVSYSPVYIADFGEWSGFEFWSGFDGNANYSGVNVGESVWAGTADSEAYIHSNIVLLGYPATVQVGDIFTISFVTNSSREIVLTSNCFTPTAKVIVPEGNVITTTQSVTFIITDVMAGGYCMYSLDGILSRWSCFNVTSITVYRPSYAGGIALGIGPNGQQACVLQPGVYSLLVSSSFTGNSLKGGTLTIASGHNTYFLNTNSSSERWVNLFNQQGAVLVFSDFQCSLTSTLNGFTVTNTMTSNTFFADGNSLYTLLVYDLFGQLLANQTNRAITTIINVQLPDIYNLKIQNLMRIATQITLTNTYSLLDFLAVGDIAEFQLHAGTYQLNYTQSELGTLISTALVVMGPMFYVLNTSYHSVFFSCFSNDGLGMPSETCRLYVNQSSSSMMRVPWGPVELMGITNVTVLDYVNATQYSNVLDLSQVSEMNIFINIATVITNNWGDQPIPICIWKNYTLLQNQTVGAKNSLSFRFTNGHYDIWNGTANQSIDVLASGTDLTTYTVNVGYDSLTALYSTQLYSYAAFRDSFPWSSNITDNYAQFYSVIITNQLANDSAVYFQWNGITLRYDVPAKGTYPLPLYVPINATYREWNGETQQFIQDSYVALSMNASNGQVLLVLGEYAPLPDYSWTGILIPIVIFGCVVAFFTVYIVKIKRTPRGEYR